MGLIKSLFKSRDKPTNQTIMNSYRFMFGGSSAGKSVTEQSAITEGGDVQRHYS